MTENVDDRNSFFPRVWRVLRPIVHQLERIVMSPAQEIGFLASMFWEAVVWGVKPPYRWRNLIAAMEFIGVGSIFIITLTAFFVGGVLAVQLIDGFRDFGAENQTGAVIGLGGSREIAPVFAALMVTSRAGSAIATEIGSMRVTNQIDALTTMAVHPIQYLVSPRLFAGAVMVPILTMLFNLIGIFGAWVVAVHLFGLDSGIFIDRMLWYVDWKDVMQGMFKAFVFGIVIILIACRQGFYARGGAEGVGRATNQAVVHSAISVLFLDYIITSFLFSEGWSF